MSRMNERANEWMNDTHPANRWRLRMSSPARPQRDPQSLMRPETDCRCGAGCAPCRWPGRRVCCRRRKGISAPIERRLQPDKNREKERGDRRAENAGLNVRSVKEMRTLINIAYLCGRSQWVCVCVYEHGLRLAEYVCVCMCVRLAVCVWVSCHMRLCALIEEQQNCSRAIGALRWCIVVVLYGGAFGAAVVADVASAGGCFAC